MSSQAIRPANQERLFELFKMAVEDERKAQELYTLALSLSSDPSLRLVLQELIYDEMRHEQILIERYNVMTLHSLTDARGPLHAPSDSPRD